MGSDFGIGKIAAVPAGNRDFDEDYYRVDRKAEFKSSLWNVIGGSAYKSIAASEKQLPVGSYLIELDSYDDRPVFVKKDVVHDALIPLSGIPDKVVKEIAEFWTKEKDFKELGFLHRRGYLFYGNQGTGKSSLVFQIISTIDDAVIFYCKNPESFNKGLSVFRQVEPTRKVICVFEDIDEIIRQFGEKTLLSVLDGDNQINSVINLATTNYPELIDKRIVGRPRRFDRVYKIEALDEHARREFLKHKLPKTEKVNKWVKKTEGLSIASISEVIISVLCFNKPIDEAVNIVKSLAEKHPTSEEEKSGVGFSGEDRNDD